MEGAHRPRATTTRAIAAAADTLKRWRSRADFVPPFEFFASILDREGGRAKLLARLGPEAADPIDEFLNLALSYDDAAPPSLTGFLAYLREADREVKRDMEHGRDEVRVMTVHGAKGLEAPIVFLPDTCTTATGGPVATLFDLDGTRAARRRRRHPVRVERQGHRRASDHRGAPKPSVTSAKPRSATGCSTSP